MNRHAAREKAMQILFQLDINDNSPEKAMTDYLQTEDIDPYLRGIVNGVANSKQTIDDTLQIHLENWTVERVASVERTVLRIAIYEIKCRDDIPKNVAINEAVKLAKQYGDEKSGQFVNGVLANIIS